MLLGFSLSQHGKVIWSYELLESRLIDVANSQNLVVWGDQVWLSLSNLGFDENKIMISFKVID